LRSAVNTVLRGLNPGMAPAGVQGVFHPPYLSLQADAAALLGQPALTVLKGGGAEFERHPGKDAHLFGLRGAAPWTGTAPALVADTRRLAEDDHGPGDLARLWSGALDDQFASAVVLGTAALALETAGAAADGMALARTLWTERNRALAA
jgi:anthranilate phosphoribosyltransferase